MELWNMNVCFFPIQSKNRVGKLVYVREKLDLLNNLDGAAMWVSCLVNGHVLYWRNWINFATNSIAIMLKNFKRLIWLGYTLLVTEETVDKDWEQQAPAKEFVDSRWDLKLSQYGIRQFRHSYT